jgi:DNA-binding protein HU-beta
MNKNELIKGISARAGLSKADAGKGLAALTDIILETLQKGEAVSLIGFGTFEVRERSERTGRNPQTGKTIKIEASKAPAFKAGAALKAAVNQK